MAFRRPEENRSSPSLGYRLSSNRQPGVEIANNRMPQQRMGPRFSPEDMPYQMPIPAPMPRPMPMPMPGPMEPFRPPPGLGPRPMPMFSPNREFDFRRDMPMPAPMPSPNREFDFRQDMLPPQDMPMAPFMEDAAIDPSDYRTIMKLIEAGLNPDDYMAANRGGIASLMR